MLLHDSTVKMLAVIRELVANDDDADVLKNCYGIDAHNPVEAELDQAVAEWAEAGCPMPRSGCGHSACDGYTECRGTNAGNGE